MALLHFFAITGASTAVTLPIQEMPPRIIAATIVHFFLPSLLFLTELLQAGFAVLCLVVDFMSTEVKTSHAVN